MSSRKPAPTGRLLTFAENDIIVSKTDLKGKITYANDVFQAVSGYALDELLGAPHSILRHPAMPRCIFKLLWDTLQEEREIFAYVLNLARSGDEYWVFAHVTPSFDRTGHVVGYHSNRRLPHADALTKIKPVYAMLLAEEQRAPDRASGLAASTAALHGLLAERGQTYGEFVFGLSAHTTMEYAAR